MFNRVEKIKGNVHYIEIMGTGTISSIYNKQPIVHIKGNGQTVRLRPNNNKGIAIGSEIKYLNDGSWVIQGIFKLEELRVENIHIIVESNNKEFSLGNYNEQNSVKIRRLRNGTINCPETVGYSLLLYKAEEKPYSIGYNGNAKYILSRVKGLYSFTKEQLNIINKDKNLLSRVTYHMTPDMMQFVKDTGVTPNEGFYDENIPTMYIEAVKAAYMFGVNPTTLWLTYKSIAAYKHPIMFRKYIRELMYDSIYSDWRLPELSKDIHDGKIFKLYDLSGKPRPKVSDEEIWMYKYLIPNTVMKDCKDSVSDILKLGLDTDREKALTVFVDKKFKYRDKVTTVPIEISDKRFKLWECGKLAAGVLAYDTQEKITMFCSRLVPFSYIMNLHSDSKVDGTITYSHVTYKLLENYKDLHEGKYSHNNMDKLSDHILSTLEDAVQKGIAVKYKDSPTLHYHGNDYYFEVLDYI